jgi:hypothetical protein
LTDRATQHALLEAIRADVRSRVECAIERFVMETHETTPESGVDMVLDDALAEVSTILTEGIVAQMRESGRIRPGQSQH